METSACIDAPQPQSWQDCTAGEFCTSPIWSCHLNQGPRSAQEYHAQALLERALCTHKATPIFHAARVLLTEACGTTAIGRHQNRSRTHISSIKQMLTEVLLRARSCLSDSFREPAPPSPLFVTLIPSPKRKETMLCWFCTRCGRHCTSGHLSPTAPSAPLCLPHSRAGGCRLHSAFSRYRRPPSLLWEAGSSLGSASTHCDDLGIFLPFATWEHCAVLEEHAMHARHEMRGYWSPDAWAPLSSVWSRIARRPR